MKLCFKTVSYVFSKILIMLISVFTLVLIACPATNVFNCSDHKGYAPRTIVYHSVTHSAPDKFDYLFVRPNDFEDQLKLLKELEFQTLFADEWHMTETPSVIITFDDGYEDNYIVVFPLLKKYNVKATVFIIADMIGKESYLSESQIIEMYDSGLVSFQSHTLKHENLLNLTKEELTNDLRLSALRIKDILGYDVKAISYPNGAYNHLVVSTASQFYSFGYTTDTNFDSDGVMSITIPRSYIARDCKLNEFLRIIS